MGNRIFYRPNCNIAPIESSIIAIIDCPAFDNKARLGSTNIKVKTPKIKRFRHRKAAAFHIIATATIIPTACVTV
jgi:hypothetical protein